MKAKSACECGKKVYKSENEARRVRILVLRKRKRKIRIYQCPTGYGYHLTSVIGRYLSEE